MLFGFNNNIEPDNRCGLWFDGDDFLFEGSYEPHSYQVLEAYQYLQSKGYALPFMGYTVEELIEAGWIKLIQG